MAQKLFERFAEIIRNTDQFDLTDPAANHPLMLDQEDVSGRQVRMLYAPFDHVNLSAEIAIVGMTPGAHQAQQALLAAQKALREGRSSDQAIRIAKVHASFSGEPMRTNLVRMMDLVGVADLLRVKTTRSLWEADGNRVQFTSALRYPVFVNGRNWSGTPDMVRTAMLRRSLLEWTGAELATLKDCLIVPLGPKVAAAMRYLAAQGFIDAKRIVDGMPHPSGANQERVATFLGDKPAERCSTKTNPEALYQARRSLIDKVDRLREAREPLKRL